MDKKSNVELKRMIKDLGAEEQLKRILKKKGIKAARKEDYCQAIRNKRRSTIRNHPKTGSSNPKTGSSNPKTGALITSAGLLAAAGLGAGVALMKLKAKGKAKGKGKNRNKVVSRICQFEECSATGSVVEVTQESLETLDNCNWIDDKVISAFALLLNRGSSHLLKHGEEHNVGAYAMGPHDYDLIWVNGEVWPEKKDKIMFPVNVGNSHWVLVLVDNTERKLMCYDSLENPSRCNPENIQMPTHVEDYTRLKVPTPQQHNKCDCGVFVMYFMYLIATGRKIKGPITQSTISDFRKLVRQAIVTEHNPKE